MLNDFHFIRPEILLIIPVLLVIVVVWMKLKLANSQWESIIPAHLHQRLVVSKGNKQSRQPYIWLMIALCIACIAAAGPAWEKLPQPVYQSDSGRVVVLDMSLSMRATDVSPNRLSRVKFKAIDLVNEINDGEVGLIAYAGDAFTISPLTEDVSTLVSLIPSLSPEIMPVKGSNPSSGLEHAIRLLENSGYQNGHIYWITDGINLDDVKPLRDLVNDSQFEYSALLVGTEAGAPIQLNDGSLLKNTQGAIVIPKINLGYLNQAFSPSNAQVTQMSIDDSDIRSMILTSKRLDQIRQNDERQSTGDAWRDMGALLVLILLPIALLLFRKGLLFSLFIALVIPITHNDAHAQTPEATAPTASSKLEQNQDDSFIKRLFMNNNQRGQRAFDGGDYQGAAQTFEDLKWRAASAYKAGDYESAAELYRQAEGIDSIYNRANALANLGDFEQAIQEYQKVLNIDSSYEQAAQNKKLLEDLLEEQQQQEQQQNQQNQDNQQSEQDDSQSQEQEQSEGDGQNQDNSEQQQNQDNQQPSEDSQEQENSSQNSEPNSQQNESAQDQQENQNDSVQDGAQEQQSPANQGNEQETSEEQQEESASVQAIDESQMTPEQREKMRRLDMLMNKVPDDPAFLLQRKMQLEAEKRRQYAPPAGQEQEW